MNYLFQISHAQPRLRRQKDVLRLAPVKAFMTGVPELAAGFGQQWQFILKSLLVQNPPADHVHGNRIGREEQRAILPGPEVRVPDAGPSIITGDQSVADVQDDLLTDSRQAYNSGNKRVTPIDGTGGMGTTDIVRHAVGEVL